MNRIASRFKETFNREVLQELRWVFAYILRYKKAVIFYILIGVAGTVMGLAGSLASKYVIDAVTQFNFSLLLTMAVVFTASGLLSIGLNAWTSRMLAKISLKVQQEILEDVYCRIMDAKWSESSKFHSGDLLNRLNGDVSEVSRSVLGWVPSLVTKTVSFVGSLILILNYDAIMALLALCSAPVTLLVSRFLLLKMRRYNQRMRQVSSDVMEFTEESFQNMQYIKSFSITGLFRRRLKGVQKKYYDISMEYNEFSIKTSTLMSVLSMVVSFVCLGWSVARLWTGHITYGTMTMFLQLSRSLAADFNALIKLVPSAISAATSAGRIMEVTELPKETVNRNVVQKLKKEASRGVYIVLEHIVYSYDGEKTVLTGGSFYASPGEIVAITGASGSGKTTLLRIILGLIEIQEGTAFVQTASGFTHSFDASTRTLVSYVPQGNTVFSGTIADNLKMIVPNATEEEMQKALEIACAWEFVSKLPNGMQCQVGENGKGLSEGQSQRIAIARAVLKKAPVIVFDEATSALDERTGRQVIQNIKREYRSCTCILVTHRTSDLDICSKVYRINQGKMVEIHENH